MSAHNSTYLGLISGTSADGIDAAIVDFSAAQPILIEKYFFEYPTDIKAAVESICDPTTPHTMKTLGKLDQQLGSLFAEAALEVLSKAKLNNKDIKAIGSHGQTVFHQPAIEDSYGYTMQIADPNIIAARTNITTIADFRRRDMAQGGQGAPFAPAFHAATLRSAVKHRAVVNIGGIANVTLLPKDSEKVVGFDTGPGNILMNQWATKNFDCDYDKNGNIASGGNVIDTLLGQMLHEPYFATPPPKSTGREYFNFNWLESYRDLIQGQSPIDVMATLNMLTAITIKNTIEQYSPETEQVLVCGGGVYNETLMQNLRNTIKNCSVDSTASAGIEPDYVEAMAFAWYAKQTFERQSINLTSITGAENPAILGAIYSA